MDLTDASRPLLRSAALAQGYSDDELARSLRRREITRLQRGAHLDPGTAPDERLRLLATVAGLRVPGVVSHASAALLHGLPLWRIPVRRLHVVRPPGSGGSGSARVHLHLARLPDEQVTAVDGVALTDVTRTVLDLARTTPFESAVVAADAALARELTTHERLRTCLDGMGPVPGVRRAARVVDFADGRGRSVGESRSRVLLHRLGLPAPDLQVEVHRADGSRIGFCDFGWAEERTVAEFDGRIEYGRLLRPGQDPGEVVSTRRSARTTAGTPGGRWRAGSGPTSTPRDGCSTGCSGPSPEAAVALIRRLLRCSSRSRGGAAPQEHEEHRRSGGESGAVRAGGPPASR